MDEGNKAFHSDFSGQVASETIPSTNFDTSNVGQSSRADARNMEFAPMASQHFGHMGAPMSPFDMRHISGALPDYSQNYSQPQQRPPFTQSSSLDPSVAYSSFQNQQFAGQTANQYPQQVNAHQRPYGTYSSAVQNPSSEFQNSRNQPFLHQQQQFAYNHSMSPQPQYPGYVGQQSGQYGQAPGLPYQTRMNAPYQVPRLQVDNSQVGMGQMPYSQNPSTIRRNSSNSSLQALSTLRGPPRKPKQSGHALWVGNLPPGTQITDLKDHFSREATDDIESVFLISKSNCAFVNYKAEESCASAMARFHDSRFRGVRLVCRLRRGSNSAPSPAIATIQADGHRTPVPATSVDEIAHPASVVPKTPASERTIKEKFFIVKSLTVEDLERSVTSGIWATQAHNENNLNAAFETAENVYLVFSANKSGEYFGYARMESRISADAVSAKDAAAAQPISTQPAPTSSADAPLTIPTAATATAPRGHIIDDSARGTIFWEADSDSLTPSSAVDGAPPDSGETSGEESSKMAAGQQTTFGKPFHISWQSTERLPFYRTRGLRNPWNANREVKIARDGTELEPTVGRKLIGMFEQQAQINAAARNAGPPPQFAYQQQMPQYHGGGMMPQAPYGYGMQGPGPSYGRPY